MQHIYICTQTWTHTCNYIYEHPHIQVKARAGCQVTLSFALHLIYSPLQSFSLNQTGQPVNCLDLPVSVFHWWGYWPTQTCLAFDVVARDQNSSSHLYRVSTLVHWATFSFPPSSLNSQNMKLCTFHMKRHLLLHIPVYMHMYTWVYFYACTPMPVYICVNACTCVSLCACLGMCASVYTYVPMCVYVHGCPCVLFVFVYTYMCFCVQPVPVRACTYVYVCLCECMHARVCLWVPACTCVLVCLFMHTCIPVCVCVQTYACVCTCVHICTCMCIYAYVFVCMCICVCVHIYLCVCVYICTCVPVCMYMYLCACVHLYSYVPSEDNLGCHSVGLCLSYFIGPKLH